MLTREQGRRMEGFDAGGPSREHVPRPPQRLHGRSRRAAAGGFTLDEAGRLHALLSRDGAPACPRCGRALRGLSGNGVEHGPERRSIVFLRCEHCDIGLTMTALGGASR